MPFPSSIPSDGTTHTEDGEHYVVVDGRWEKRPPCYIVLKECAQLGACNVSPKKDDMTQRMRIHAALHMGADTGLRLNILGRLDPALPTTGRLDPTNNNHYKNLTGNLSNGSGRWRQGVWTTTAPSATDGIWLNWPTNEWRLAYNKYGYCQVNIHAIDDTWSALDWVLTYYQSALNTGPARVEGSGMVKITPNRIDALAFTTDHLTTPFGFQTASFTVESY